MDVMEAVPTAKNYLAELLAGEKITHVGLEEVVFDEVSNCWKITVGFFRPWDRKEDGPHPLLSQIDDRNSRRTYKVVHIDDASGKAVSLTNRVPAAAD